MLTRYINPGSPWQNGYIESFHSRFRDECLSRAMRLNLREARVVIAAWRNMTSEKDPIVGWAILARKAF
ncbi:MAG TPA: transposase [Candidatus Latescibacteria bacterium]|nr:transposase [Candidatus Handelsmanbacteria bacterium]HIL11319.1 transposase [Candidatus Latescibacterota bacterium]